MDTVNIYIPPYLPPNLSAINGFVCNTNPSGTITLSVNGNGFPFTYELLNPPPGYSPTVITVNDTFTNFSGLLPGNYLFMVYDDCGASSDYSATVGPLEFTPLAQRYCNGTLFLHAPFFGGVTYEWKNGNGEVIATQSQCLVNNPNADTYSVSASGGGCYFSTSIFVPQYNGNNASLSASAGNDIDLFFHGNYINTTLSGNQPPSSALSVRWKNITQGLPDVSFTNPYNYSTDVTFYYPGTYFFEYRIEMNECISVDTLKVFLFDCSILQPLAVTPIVKPETCKGTSRDGQISLNITEGAGPFQILWGNGETAPVLQGLQIGIYTVTITDTKGCFPGNDQVNLTVLVGASHERIQASFTSIPDNQYELLLSSPIKFTNQSTNADYYVWTFGAYDTSTLADVTYSFPEPGKHLVTLTAYNEFCKAKTQKIFNIIPDGSIYIANAFTPNKDLDNNFFGPIGKDIEKMQFSVYDRAGGLLFYSENPDVQWDGRFNQKDCPEGVYVFTLFAYLKNGRVYHSEYS